MEVLDEDYFGSSKHNRTIEDLIENGYETDMYRYIREGFELFKKNPGMMVAYTLIFALISFGLSEVKFGSVIEIFVGPCLIAGWYIATRRLAHNQPLEFSHFFEGFRKWQILVPYNLISYIFVIFGLILLILPGIYLAVSYLLVVPIILFYPKEMSLIDTLEGCRQVITKKWWNFLGFCGLLVLVNIAGVLCLGVGLLVSIPVSMCAFYAMYDDIFGVPLHDDQWDTQY